MGKSNYFSSKSVFGQHLSLINDKTINDAVKKHDSDRYVKRFKSKDHLLSMLFFSFAKCNSLREVSGAMLGLSGKTNVFGLKHIPKHYCPIKINSYNFGLEISKSRIHFHFFLDKKTKQKNQWYSRANAAHHEIFLC